MAKTYTYPHWETNVIDRSIYTPLVRETLPLLRPIFFMRAAKGPVGVPQFISSYNDAKSMFGDATFDETTEYFSREALFLKQLFSRQGAFITRMASSDAKKASFVLELQVKKQDVTQYERDANGQYKLDPITEERIPLKDATTGATVTEPGVELKWMTRAMKLDGDTPETLENLKPVTYGSGENEYVVYPILACMASYVGKAINDTGVKFFVDLDNMDETLATNVQSLPFDFGAVEKSYGDDTVSPLYSNLQNQYETFVAKPNTTDTRVDRNVSFDDVISNYYEDELPFEMKLFNENLATVGAMVQELEPEDETLTDPYLVNLTSELNIDGIPMPHVVFSEDNDAIVLNDTRILYLQGGEDGSIDDAAIEELTRQYLNDLVYPEFLDQARYPFTHIFDTGVSMATKKAFINFMGTHDAFKVVLSTQDANMGRMNTKNEDLSAGSSLYATCLLQPESSIKGTECCRAEIYQQCGLLADSTYKGIIPATLDVMLKKSRWESTTAITGHPGGLPNSAITIFKNNSWNWTPCDADHKQRSWDSGLNYFQYYDQQGIHWPAMRTVYRYDTSVLTSAMFTDVVVFTKHVARYNWSRYAGVELPFSVVGPRAASSVSTDLAVMLNGMYSYDVSFTQSDEEAKIGYISHATIRLWGNPMQRVWKIDIECYRNGYDPDSSNEETA